MASPDRIRLRSARRSRGIDGMRSAANGSRSRRTCRADARLLRTVRGAFLLSLTKSDVRILWMAITLLPYAMLAGVDTWMHEKSRRVPKVEKILHALAGVLLIGFIVCVFGGFDVAGIAAFVAFAIVASADEFGFHRHLSTRERKVHFASYAALAIFVMAWRLGGAVA